MQIDDAHLHQDTEAETTEGDASHLSVTTQKFTLYPGGPSQPMNPAPPSAPPGWPTSGPPPTWSDWSNYVFKVVNPAGPLKHAKVTGNLYSGTVIPLQDSETTVQVKLANMDLDELLNADDDEFKVEGTIESKRTAVPPGRGGGGASKPIEQTYDKDWDAKVKYPRFDMTVDANNDGEIGGNDHKDQKRYPSKYVPVNDADANRDGIPGFAELKEPELELTKVRLRVGRVTDKEGATLTFQYPQAPLIDANGADTVYTPGGKIRLWKKQSGERAAGDLIKPGTAYDAAELLQSGVFIEGVKPSASAADVEITAKWNGPNLKQEDLAKITVYKVDADVDSDNNGAIDPAEYCLEDQNEVMAEKPGKILEVDDADGDGDGRPGFADGFEKFANATFDDAPAKDQKFTLLKVKLSDALDLSKVKLRFTYDASDPDEIEQSGQAPNFTYRPAPGKLRVWVKDGTVSRKKDSVEDGGDFVPKDVLLTPEQVKMQGRVATLYVEGIRTSEAAGDLPIEVEVLPTGDEAGGMHGDEVRVTCIGVDLAVDHNRDGQIDFQPYGGGSPDVTERYFDKEFKFWVNDDDDELFNQDAYAPLLPHTSITLLYAETEEDDKDVNESHHENWESNNIDCKRDLEDFTRLWVDTSRLGPLMPKLQSGEFKLRLKHVWGGGGIKVFKAVDKGSLAYLEDIAKAEEQIGVGYGHVIGGELVLNKSIDIPKDAIVSPKIPFLFEGTLKGRGLVVPILVDAEGREFPAGRGVFFDIKEPKEFIERYTCGEDSGGAVSSHATLHSGSGPAFPAPVTDEEKDYVLYVHGYNMDPNTKQRWIETTFKRLYWQGYKGRTGGLSWPCTYGTLDQAFFDVSEYRAWQSGAPLEQLLNELKGKGYRVHVLAHSQGNVVAGEALRLWSRGATEPLVSTYVASQAAIPAACYDKEAQLMVPHDEDTYDVYKTYWAAGSDTQHPALWNVGNPSYCDAGLTHVAASQWVNFYNPLDYALTGNGFFEPGHPGWCLDQRQKPDVFEFASGWNYGYTDRDGFFRSRPLIPASDSLEFPKNRYEIFSYGAGAWSKATGAYDTQGVFTGSALDLNASLAYGKEHVWHSGQFRSFLASKRPYWRALLEQSSVSTGGNP